MSLPNFQLYYWAANIRPIIHWLYEDPGADAPSWCALEERSCSPSSLAALVHSSLAADSTPFTKNLLVRATLKIWKQIRRRYGWHCLSFRAPIHSNHMFPPSLEGCAFLNWQNKGLKTIKDLFVDGYFISFQQMCLDFSIPRTNFFRYLQIRDFVRKQYAQFPALPSQSEADDLLTSFKSFKGIISVLYNSLSSLHNPSLAIVKHRWEQDLGTDLTDAQWAKILKRVHTSSICARHGLLQCKVLHRIHWSKEKLSKRFPGTDPTCDRCKITSGSYFHTFWSCSKLITFWTHIFKILSGTFRLPLDPCPMMALFGVSPDPCPLNKYQRDFLAFCTLLARRQILLNWKNKLPPSYSMWIKDILYFMKMEKIRHTLNGRTARFYEIWQPFLIYVKEELDIVV